jgi:hypothetical protein
VVEDRRLGTQPTQLLVRDGLGVLVHVPEVDISERIGHEGRLSGNENVFSFCSDLTGRQQL